MKKDKETKLNPEETSAKVRKPARNDAVVSGYNKNDLNSELERLAELFKEELINQGEMEEDVLRDAQGIIYEDEVCECCGERRKAKGSDFCKPCQDAMRRYPLSIPMIAVAVVMLAFAIFSVFDFSQNFDGYYTARKAKIAADNRELYSAVSYYDEAIQFFEGESINPKVLKFRCIDAMYDINVMLFADQIILTYEGALEDYEAKLPIYNKQIEKYDEVYVLRETFYMMLEINSSEEYQTAYSDEEVYEEAMTAIGSLIDAEVTVPSLDGETRIYKSNEALVRCCQYLYAYSIGNSEDVYYYVNEVYKLAPQYIGVYGYDLGMVCAQTRNFSKALEVADAMYNNDIEEGSSFGIRSVVERMKGNYSKAIEWADKGLEKNAGNGDLLRYKAMAQICNGDLKGAKEIMDGIIASGGTDYLYISVSLVIETELGNTENVETIKEQFETNESEIPDRVQDYLDGELTAKELFTEGSGDVA